MVFLIFLVVLIIAAMIVANLFYTVFAGLQCRIKDLCEQLGVSTAVTPVLIVFVGILFLTGCPQDWWIGAVCIAIPVGYWLIKTGTNIWKVIIVKILGFPIFVSLTILNIICGHQKSRTRSHLDGSRTVYTLLFPSEINTGEWQLTHTYTIAGAQFYQNEDGRMCLVNHKYSSKYYDVQYDITPLYNVNDPKPWWIRWLYEC